jgi:hypothetical protein
MSEKLIRFGGGGVRAIEIESIHKALPRVIAVVTKAGRHHLADYSTNTETDADLVRMMDEWDAWGAGQ